MKVKRSRPTFIPVLVDSGKFQTLWQKSNMYISLQSHEFEDPKIGWCVYEKEERILELADCYINCDKGGGVSFTNGRHRTAWLLSKGLKHIPIGLHEDDVEACIAAGIVVRVLHDGEDLPCI